MRRCRTKTQQHPIEVLRMTGLEPARHKHQNLNLARLPIPPYPQIYIVLKK